MLFIINDIKYSGNRGCCYKLTYSAFYLLFQDACGRIKENAGRVIMIGIGNCGFGSVHQTAFSIRRPKGSPDYVLLLIKTEAYFEEGGITAQLPPCTAILYQKDTYVHYGSTKPDYCNDWIHFTAEKEDLDFLLSLQIPFNTPMPIPHLTHLSEIARMIVLDKHTWHTYRSQSMDALMRALLYSLASQINSSAGTALSHRNYDALNQLRMAIINTPGRKWTIESMAKTVHMSPSYLQHSYKKMFGLTCMQECINARLKHARLYLCTTDMSVHMVALLCGYDNETHFMRQFKKSENMTPSEYRKHYQI